MRPAREGRLMPLDPQRVQALFLIAAEKSPADRAALLTRECGGDNDLRRRVEALLLAHDQPQSFLQAPAVDLKATADTNASLVGTTIGPYKLFQQIGEGGMGVVYLAEQT